MKRKLILYTTAVLLMNIGGRGVMAQNLKQKTLKKAFSPKMLVYENLKNENVLKHFKNRFAQLDTLQEPEAGVQLPDENGRIYGIPRKHGENV
jgi:hypothetical protein